jgi:hypothetical protein
MGAVPYDYFVPYRDDIAAALRELREREFRAGRYNPALPFPQHSGAAAPGAQHPTIQAALKASGADGTRSILDLDRISPTPRLGAVSPLSEALRRRLFGTERPSRDMVEQGAQFEHLDRGQGVYIVVYKADRPDEIYFAGYSYD